MNTFLTFLVLAVIVCGLLYFKVPQVKAFVDAKFSNIFSKTKENLVDGFKGPAEPTSSLPGTPVPTPSKESIVEPVKTSEGYVLALSTAAYYNPNRVQAPDDPNVAAAVEVSRTSKTSNMYKQVGVNLSTDTSFVFFDVPKDHLGPVKITLTESVYSSAGDKAVYTICVIDPMALLVENTTRTWQYTGGSVDFIPSPGYTYQVAIKANMPCVAILTING